MRRIWSSQPSKHNLSLKWWIWGSCSPTSPASQKHQGFLRSRQIGQHCLLVSCVYWAFLGWYHSDATFIDLKIVKLVVVLFLPKYLTGLGFSFVSKTLLINCKQYNFTKQKWKNIYIEILHCLIILLILVFKLLHIYCYI